MGRQTVKNLQRDLSKEREGKGGKEQKQRSDYRSLKTDGETESTEPTQVSLDRERGEERRRARTEIRVTGL